MKHLRFNEFDMAAITNEVNSWKSSGLHADYDLHYKEEGLVRVQLENNILRDGSIMMFDIHKVGRPGIFKNKVQWIVELWSSDSDRTNLEKRGCVMARTLAGALIEAHLDVKHGFLSVLDFDMALAAASTR